MNYSTVSTELNDQMYGALQNMQTWDADNWSHYNEEKGSGTLNDIALAIKRQGGV